MNPIEMVMRRRVFRAFVKADPVSVAFVRLGPPVKQPSGGTRPGEPISLAPQEGRIVQSKRRYDPGLVNSEAGEIPDTEYLLLGYHDMDVQVTDRFIWRNQHYKVLGVHPTRVESTLCAIEFDGEANGE